MVRLDQRDALTLLKHADENGSHAYTNLSIAWQILDNEPHCEAVKELAGQLHTLREEQYRFGQKIELAERELKLALDKERAVNLEAGN